MANQRGIYAALISVLGWGMGGLFIKLLPGISAIWITAVRSIIAVVVLLLFVISQSHLRPILRKINTRHNWELGFYNAVFYLFAVMAYQWATVAEAALVLSITPLFILLWSVIKGQRIPSKDTIGSFVALLGILIIFWPRLEFNFHESGTQLFGLLAALGGCLAIAIFVLRIGHLEKTGHQPDVWGIIILSFSMLSIPLLYTLFSDVEMRAIQKVWEGNMKWIALAFGVFSTAIPGVAYSYASITLPAILTTSLRFLVPVVATILAAIFLKEIPSINIYAGGVLVLFGLFWMTLSDRIFGTRNQAVKNN